jgi:phenylalanyl-tRNA synthetase alpha subunit
MERILFGFYFVSRKLPLAEVQETNGRRLNWKQEDPFKDHSDDFWLLG